MTLQSPICHYSGEGSSSSTAQSHHEPALHKDHEMDDAGEPYLQNASFEMGSSTEDSETKLVVFAS